MAIRIGNVIYWAGVIFAWLFALVAFSGATRGIRAVPIEMGLALISYGVGWGVRYLLTGKRSP